MRKLVLIIVALTALGLFREECMSQTKKESVFVKYVVLDTEFDARFIWSIANAAIPWDRKTTVNDIQCATKEFQKTGLFEGVATHLSKIDSEAAFELIISLKFRDKDPVYKVGQINLDKLEGVNIAKLRSAIDKSGLLGSEISLKPPSYAAFEDRLREMVNESAEPDGDRSLSVNPVFNLSLSDRHQLVIDLALKHDECPDRN